MAIILKKGRITSAPSIPLNTSYERPSDWTDLPALSQGDEKIYMLVNVGEPDGSNYMRIKIFGDYQVDWGDGTAVTTLRYTAVVLTSNPQSATVASWLAALRSGNCNVY